MSNELSKRIARELWNYYLEIDSEREEGGDAAIAKGAEMVARHLAAQPAQPMEIWNEAIRIVKSVSTVRSVEDYAVSKEPLALQTEIVAALEAARDTAP